MLKKTDGFSLVELLIAIVALIIGLLLIFELIVSQKKSFKVEHELIKMTQNIRASVDILLREFRMAGYKTLEADFLNSLQDWISSEYLPTSLRHALSLTKLTAAILPLPWTPTARGFQGAQNSG